MSYYAYYDLMIEPPEKSETIRSFLEEYQSIIHEFRNTCPKAEEAFDVMGGAERAITWDTFEADFRAFSAKFPKLRFCMNVQGEENLDYWAMYAVNGKLQRVKADLVYEPFDESKLK